MRTSTLRPLLQAAAIAACLAGALHAAPEVERIYFNGKDFKGGQVIVPKLQPGAEDSQRWVIVDVHGAGGPKKNWFGYRMLKWFDEGKVIALAPVFGEGYHLGDGEAAKQLIEHFEWIKQRYKVHEKMFLTPAGWSGSRPIPPAPGPASKAGAKSTTRPKAFPSCCHAVNWTWRKPSMEKPRTAASNG
jgi:hypothetical protein